LVSHKQKLPNGIWFLKIEKLKSQNQKLIAMIKQNVPQDVK